MQNLHPSTWEHDILYADRNLKNEQLLTKRVFFKTSTTTEGGWMLQFIFCFTEITHKLLHLDKLNSLQQRIVDLPTRHISVMDLL